MKTRQTNKRDKKGKKEIKMKEIKGMSPIFNWYRGLFPQGVKLTTHVIPVTR
jgi:hypothetical protein